MTIKPDLKHYLEYVANTAGNVTIAQFDDDWEPIGPMIRRQLMPLYIIVNSLDKLILTEEGKEALQ